MLTTYQDHASPLCNKAQRYYETSDYWPTLTVGYVCLHQSQAKT